MPLPKAEPTVAETVSISVECGDCGHTRWLRPAQLGRFGIGPNTLLAALAERLSCSECRADGLPGKSISVQAAFAAEVAQRGAQRWSGARTPVTREAGLRARRS